VAICSGCGEYDKDSWEGAVGRPALRNLEGSWLGTDSHYGYKERELARYPLMHSLLRKYLFSTFYKS